MSFFQTKRFRIVQFNVENLFILLDHYSGQDLKKVNEKEWQAFSASTTPNKSLAHVRELARVVCDLDPDILMLCEVGGRESLINFSRLFLGDRYTAHLLEGNSDRGIDLGYLVKRSLPFSYDLISHKHRAIDFLYPHELLTQEAGYDHLRSARITSHRFSRDVLEIRIFEPGGGDFAPNVAPNVAPGPCVVLMLVHLKSQLDRNRIDPGGRDRRRAELHKLLNIYREIHDEFQARTPVLLAGDFNGVAAWPNPDEEFRAIYDETHLRDCLEIVDIPRDERFTYQQLYRNRPGVHRQLDYLFVPPELESRVNHKETWVFRFRDEFGMTQILPRNLNEKKLLPSDHYPVVLTLNAIPWTEGHPLR
jgi:hypothetical protein